MPKTPKIFNYSYQTIADSVNKDVKLVRQDEQRGLFALHDFISVSLYVSKHLLDQTMEINNKNKEISF